NKASVASKSQILKELKAQKTN
ncbi:hypothetical protein BMETH_217309831642268, partial [methanotrophic bacterial endosymbiont of Bathymodiolus sp.]